MGMKGLLKAACGAVATLALGCGVALSAVAQELVGQPTDKEMGFQPTVTALGREVTWFYNGPLIWVIYGISILVGVLLLWIIIRYNKKSNPNAARFSHNTLIEIIWTVVPVLILVVIAVMSLDLLKKFNDMPKPDVVVKATGNQWYWAYDYPELGVEGVEARLHPDATDIAKSKAAGVPYLLATDNKMVVPVNKVVHLQATANDVIHAWTVPAFRVKTDAIPGRLNSIWFKAEKIGVYYGQCSELCGKDHAYMPIEVHVVSDADFDAWVVSNGGKTRAMIAAEAQATAAAEAQAAAAASASAAAPVAVPAEAVAVPAAAAAPRAAKPAASSPPTAPAVASSDAQPVVTE